MSFLPPENESLVSVEEALAFLDDFGSDNSDSSASPSLDDAALVPAVPLPDAKTGKTQHKQKPTQKKKRRMKNPPGYSTKLQQRKRAEIYQLRDEVQELTAHLTELKKAGPGSRAVLCGLDAETAQSGQQTANSKCLELATSEYKARRRSEETNRKLRAILAQQGQVNQSLRTILQKRTVLQGMDYVFASRSTVHRTLAGVENRVSIMAHLEDKLARLYLDSGSVFQPGPPPTMSSSMAIKQYAQLGKTVEMVSTTPMACSMQVAADLIWKELNEERQCPEKWSCYVKAESRPNTLEKSWVLTLLSESVVKSVNGLQLLRKFEEPNRIVLVKADLMTLTTEGLQFRDQAWTVVTRSESDPQNASVVRMCEQIYMDCQDGFSALPEDVMFAQTVVLKNIAWKLRKHSQEMQNMLASESGLIAMAPPVQMAM